MKKGTTITEEQVNWSEISQAAWSAAQSAAAARAANGNPMSDDEITRRARNAQDREDLRHHLWGGNLSADCKNMNRSELVAEANRQLQTGLYGTSKQAYRTLRNAGLR